MFSNIGFPGLILILVAVLILFGPKIAGNREGFRETLKEFKNQRKN